ncbi:MAG: single-stranded DNA-binding protein [Pontiellaceae bacterium]|nr:single-stranded DNA-binding protein [Pontiellaceae bacterium]
MAAMNNVVLAGNLTRRPELQHTESGTAFAHFGLAINENYKNKAGELVEKVVFVDCNVWGKQAEAAAEHLDKGSPVLLQGRLQLDQWENEKKEKRSALRVRADRLQFLHRASANGRPEPNDADAPAEYEDGIPF